jgi:hypothetical protein
VISIHDGSGLFLMHEFNINPTIIKRKNCFISESFNGKV